jgi:hypothetical protein
MSDEGDSECMQSFGGETCRTTFSWRLRTRWESKIDVTLRMLDCEVGGRMEVSIGGPWHCWAPSVYLTGVWVRAAVVAAVFSFGTEARSSQKETRKLTCCFLELGVTSWTLSWETLGTQYPFLQVPLHCIILPCPSSPSSVSWTPLNVFFVCPSYVRCAV